MSALTSALIEYLQKLPQRPLAARCRLLDETRSRVQAGECGPSAFVPFALADADEVVVAGATASYLSAARSSDQFVAAAGDATEWVRRGLAINRGAVFAALLLRGVDDINEQLLPLRLTLSAEEVATVIRYVRRRRCERTREFLEEWHELLHGDATARERRHIAEALGAPRTCAA